MELYTDDFYSIDAPPAIEINIRPNILYTEEYSYLTRDELEVLFLLATTEMSDEGLSFFSFSGIKRQLGKHQQKITKAVNRLLSSPLTQARQARHLGDLPAVLDLRRPVQEMHPSRWNCSSWQLPM